MQAGLGDVGHADLWQESTLPQEVAGPGSAGGAADPLRTLRPAIRVPACAANDEGLGRHGSAFLSGARVTTASMSAIALTMNRAVIGVPS